MRYIESDSALKSDYFQDSDSDTIYKRLGLEPSGLRLGLVAL